MDRSDSKSFSRSLSGFSGQKDTISGMASNLEADTGGAKVLKKRLKEDIKKLDEKKQQFKEKLDDLTAQQEN